MIVHQLNGCAAMPLAHYLKALGILRLVAEQLDPEARGWWEGNRFLLASEKGEEELGRFFLETYAPTPMLAPWNGASGFFRTWDAKSHKLRNSGNSEALNRLLGQQEVRWEPLRATYQTACDVLASVLREVDVAVMPEKERKRLLIVPRGSGPVFPVADKDKDKAIIQRAMLQACGRVPFFRSAIVDVGDKFSYPSLLGSGGNDGAIDFTGRFFQNLVAALIETTSPSGDWLRSAMFAEIACSLQTGKEGKVGQFLPGGAGGANMSAGPGDQDDTLLNPWDFILMLEGTMLFAAATTRRLQSLSQARAAAPFSVAANAFGYASAGSSDESARGEQWMPLWSQPVKLAELQRLFAEGRAQLGANTAGEPLDLARAIARLGASRGIRSFQRYGYIERNGQSNLAVPLGRLVVPDHAEARLACLDDLDVWLRRLRREARSDKAPARLVAAERQLSDALLSVTQDPDGPMRWQVALLRMADIEAVQAHGTGAKAGPIPKLRPAWAQVADDGSAEIRLALAFALQRTDGPDGRQGQGIRRHWAEVDEASDRSARVMQGRSGMDDATAVVARQLIEVQRSGQRRLPLAPGCGIAAGRHDLARLLAGQVDLDHCLTLARAFMALDAVACRRQPPRLSAAPPADWPDDAWIAIRLAMLPWPLPDGRSPGCDPAILRRLQSGDAASAVELATRRLRVAGIHCPVGAVVADAALAARYAAALAFPITRRTAALLAERLHPSATKENAA